MAKQKAKEVLGIEPGDEGIVGSKKYGIPMIQDFFPTAQLGDKKFDVVLSHCMLEHVEDPLTLLSAMYEAVVPGGIVFFAVPDSGPKMEIGDLSTISHQHINNFTQESSRHLLRSAGFTDVEVVASKRRSMLYAWGVRGEKRDTEHKIDEKTEAELIAHFAQFIKSWKANVDALQKEATVYTKEGKSIGLYAPDTSLPGLLGGTDRYRIFNSDSVKHGKYISESALTFEGPEELVANPPDVVFVAPIDYEREIIEDLRRRGLPETTKLVSLKEIYERENGLMYTVGSMNNEEYFS